MNWTALIAEYFVVGCHTFAWLFLLLLASGNIDLTKLRDAIANQPDSIVAAGGVALAVAIYSVGIVLDTIWFNLSMKLLKRRNVQLLKPYAVELQKESIGRWFYTAEDSLSGVDGLRDRMFRRRSRIRVFRSLIFNLPMIILLASLLRFSWWLVFLGLLLEALTVIAFFRTHDQYVRMVARHGRATTAVEHDN